MGEREKKEGGREEGRGREEKEREEGKEGRREKEREEYFKFSF